MSEQCGFRDGCGDDNRCTGYYNHEGACSFEPIVELDRDETLPNGWIWQPRQDEDGWFASTPGWYVALARGIGVRIGEWDAAPAEIRTRLEHAIRARNIRTDNGRTVEIKPAKKPEPVGPTVVSEPGPNTAWIGSIPDAPKSRAEIEAEKATKPRPDLLPARALAMVTHGGVCAVLTEIADYMQTRDIGDLAPVLSRLLDECVAANIAPTRAAVLLLAGEIMGVGLRKHGPCTWRIAGTEQADPQTHYASAIRHLLEHAAGVKTDPDSGRHPLLHAVCQIAIMIDLLDYPPKVQGKNDGRATIGNLP